MNKDNKNKKYNNATVALAATNTVLTSIGTITDVVNNWNNDPDKQAELIVGAISNITDSVLALLPPTPICTLVSASLKLGLTIISEGIRHTQYYDYTFIDAQNENNKYTWNGGKTVYRFWGLWKDEKRTIKDAKLLKPVQFIKPVMQNVYLYNGRIYTESEFGTLKSEIMFNEKNSISFFDDCKVYSVDEGDPNKLDSNKLFPTKESSLKYIKKHINDYIDNTITLNEQ